LQSFLADSRQKVCVSGAGPTWSSVVTGGVPEGSALGPVLVVCYINDMPEMMMRSMIYLCADDAKIARHILNVSDISALQQDLDKLDVWAKNGK